MLVVKSNVSTVGIHASGMPLALFNASFSLCPKMCSLKINATMGQCLSLLLLVVIKQQFWLLLVSKNIIQSMSQ
jgi:hypothetical protein